MNLDAHHNSAKITMNACLFLSLLALLVSSTLGHFNASDPDHTTPGDCNICGCHDCYIYNELATVKFYYPKTDLWYQNNCKTLRDQFSKNPQNMEPSWCWNELWTYTYAACGCAFPNGTLLSDVYDGRTEEEPLHLPASYYLGPGESAEDAVQQALQGEAVDVEAPEQGGGYDPYQPGQENIQIPESKYFSGQPGSYKNYVMAQDTREGRMRSAASLTSVWGGATLLAVVCAQQLLL